VISLDVRLSIRRSPNAVINIANCSHCLWLLDSFWCGIFQSSNPLPFLVSCKFSFPIICLLKNVLQNLCPKEKILRYVHILHDAPYCSRDERGRSHTNILMSCWNMKLMLSSAPETCWRHDGNLSLCFPSPRLQTLCLIITNTSLSRSLHIHVKVYPSVGLWDWLSNSKCIHGVSKTDA
jgi:hypothetical protein